MALTLPAAAALIAIPFFLIDGLYTRGEFTAFDAAQTGRALFFYGLGTPAFVLTQLYSRAFYARQDTASPMRYALISVAVNIVLGVTLVQTVGFQGIAAATAVASWLNLIQMAAALGRRGDYLPGREAWSRLIRTFLAALALGALLALAAHFRPQIEAPFAGFHVRHLVGAKEIAILLTVTVGALLYPLFLLGFGGLKLSEVRSALRRQPKGPSLTEEAEADIGKTPGGPDLL
jgi:putative peptidoglycan lipid II flippase